MGEAAASLGGSTRCVDAFATPRMSGVAAMTGLEWKIVDLLYADEFAFFEIVDGHTDAGSAPSQTRSVAPAIARPRLIPSGLRGAGEP
jgi:hypothetical protein